ncbi:virulence RhuM family protein [Cyanobium sp. FGCU-6]|nr:virulence RhuM family protein [Cyanobium sp. FGCU6]
MNDLILYTTDDGHIQIKLRAKDQTVWLSQLEMPQLFDVSTNSGLHLKTIFADGELEPMAVTEESSVTAADGNNYLTKLYNLDAILAVGYWVRSPLGVQFRRGFLCHEPLVR